MKHDRLQKINRVMKRFESSMLNLHNNIDKRSRIGKTNEDSEHARKHLKGINENGERCWSF